MAYILIHLQKPLINILFSFLLFSSAFFFYFPVMASSHDPSSDTPSSRPPSTRTSSSRKPNYTIEDDKHLCNMYMEISQDPEVGIYQKRESFWNRIEDIYNLKRRPTMSERSFRSLETRMQIILSSISKFKGCVQQVEYQNPSGCSEADILEKANDMMKLDPKFKPAGFKFQHLWSMMKDFTKFDCTAQSSRRQNSSFQSETPLESPISPDGLSSFSINLSDGSGSGSGPPHRPDGVKKTKNKRKKAEDMSCVLKAIEQGNKRIGDLMENSSTTKDQILQIQLQKIEAKNKATEAKKQAIAFQRWESDNKILMIDTDNISDPIRREYFKSEQAKIIFKRQQQASPNDDFNIFGGNFQDFGGSGSDFGGSGSDLGAY